MKIKKNNIVYIYLKSISRALEKIISDKRKALLAVLTGLLILFVLTRFKKAFFTILLILLGSFSMIYIRFFKQSHYIAFELCTLATVLSSLAYGPHYGIVAGFISISLSFVISGYFKPTYLISVLAMPFMAVIAPFFSSLPLWQIGLIITIIYDSIILPLYVLSGSRVSSTIVFFISHVLLNYWVFSTIGPIIYNIIS